MSSEKTAAIAYLYHDAASAAEASPLLHSTLLVLAVDRRPSWYRNETPLFTQAAIDAAVAAAYERCAEIVEGVQGWTGTREVAAAIRAAKPTPR